LLIQGVFVTVCKFLLEIIILYAILCEEISGEQHFIPYIKVILKGISHEADKLRKYTL